MFPPTLLLNADFQPLTYFPLSTLSWQDAISAVVKGTHVVVEEYDTVIRSPEVSMKLPSILALKKYIPPKPHVPFTRYNVFLRDRFTCQYCKTAFKAHDLNFDHVVPRSMGGKTNFENIVASCYPCNTDKGSHPIKPMRAPYRPTVFELQDIGRRFPPNFLHESWADYLYWDTELEID